MSVMTNNIHIHGAGLENSHCLLFTSSIVWHVIYRQAYAQTFDLTNSSDLRVYKMFMKKTHILFKKKSISLFKI